MLLDRLGYRRAMLVLEKHREQVVQAWARRI